jgi:hypothetical protein
MLTLQNMYQAALDSQTACNLSGVLFSLGRYLDEVLPEGDVTSHPAVILFVQSLENAASVYGEDTLEYSHSFRATVKEFVAVMHVLCDHVYGTAERNHHPAVQAYVRILLGMVPAKDMRQYSDAVTQCELCKG